MTIRVEPSGPTGALGSGRRQMEVLNICSIGNPNHETRHLVMSLMLSDIKVPGKMINYCSRLSPSESLK